GVAGAGRARGRTCHRRTGSPPARRRPGSRRARRRGRRTEWSWSWVPPSRRSLPFQVDLKSRAAHDRRMEGLSISQVARQVGLRPSAIRYYEDIGVLAPPRRVNGRRRYDQTTAARLALILRARATGFSLDEIPRLFFAFP